MAATSLARSNAASAALVACVVDVVAAAAPTATTATAKRREPVVALTYQNRARQSSRGKVEYFRVSPYNLGTDLIGRIAIKNKRSHPQPIKYPYEALLSPNTRFILPSRFYHFAIHFFN